LSFSIVICHFVIARVTFDNDTQMQIANLK